MLSNYWDNEIIINRFWEKVEKKENNECWLWNACCNNIGYGKFAINGKTNSSHRVSFEIHHKRFILNEMCILHKCDNRKCVNPYHLSEGTIQDNHIDMINKKRHRYGENHNFTKFTEDEIKEIKKLLNDNKITRKEIIEKYHISNPHLSNIKNNNRRKIL